MTLNIANVILILGALWIHYVYGLSHIWTYLLIIFAIVAWSYHGFSDERKKLLEAEAKYYKAKSEYYSNKANDIRLRWKT